MNFQQSYFELFGLETRFDVDLDTLRGTYRDLQKVLHPDKFASASDQERRISLQQAAHVNTAFETLKDPLTRARYMLTLRGVEDKAEHSTIRDVEFLEEQMELRETLADIRGEADPMAALLGFISRLNSSEKEYIAEMRTLFDSDESDASERISNIVNRLQFVRRLLQEAEALEEELLNI